jgi:hypothetical protein
MTLLGMVLSLTTGCGGRSDEWLEDVPSDAGRLDATTNRDAGSLPQSMDASLPIGPADARPFDAPSSTPVDSGTVTPVRDAQARRTLVDLLITPADFSLSVGGMVTYQLVGIYSDMTKEDVADRVSLTSGDKNVAAISGVSARAVGAGTVKIFASLEGRSATAVLHVTDDPATVTSVEVTVASPCMSGQSLQARATAVLSNGRRRDVTYTATWESDSASAVVSTQGQIVCLGDGGAVIAATAEGVRGVTKLLSSGPAPTQVQIVGPSVLKPGELGVYTVFANFADGRVIGLPPPGLMSSDPGVLKFLKPGTAQAGSAGTTAVTGSFSGGKLVVTKNVTVSIATLIKLAITPASLEVVAPNSGKFTVVGIYSDGTQFDVTDKVAWEDVNSRVSVETGTGVVHPQGLGTSTVTAYRGDGELPTSATVTVSPGMPSSLILNSETLSAPVGVARTPQALAVYSDGSQLDATPVVTWHADDPTIASVSGGTLVGLKPGTTKYFASYAELTSNSQGMIVSNAKLATLRLGATDLIVELPVAMPATNYPLALFGTFDDGTEEDVTESATYTVGNPQVVTVSNLPKSKGQLTGVAPGVTTVTATLGVKMVSTSVTVVAATPTADQ